MSPSPMYRAYKIKHCSFLVRDGQNEYRSPKLRREVVGRDAPDTFYTPLIAAALQCIPQAGGKRQPLHTLDVRSRS